MTRAPILLLLASCAARAANAPLEDIVVAPVTRMASCAARAANAPLEDIVVAPVTSIREPPPPLAPAAPDRRVAVRQAQVVEGRWKMHDSAARVRIWFEDGAMRVRIWDGHDGDERFEVLEQSWDGEHLHIKMRYVPNDWTTICDLVVKDADTLEGERSGAAGGHLIWTRVRDGEPEVERDDDP